ncbi:MAG: PorT family protein, partial [Bacteroidetes bacterium]|nr:PorT family protein [Bacteroidota bacterium]
HRYGYFATISSDLDFSSLGEFEGLSKKDEIMRRVGERVDTFIEQKIRKNRNKGLAWRLAGLSVVNVEEKDGVRFGYNIGLIGDLKLGDNFAFSVGLLYNSYGGNVKYLDMIRKFETEDETYDSIAANSSITYKMQYIEIPVSLKGKTNEIGYITYFLKAGISPQIRYRAKAEVLNNTDEILDGKVAPFFSFGVHIGGGIEYSLGGNTKLLVEALYTTGLTDIEKVDIGLNSATEKNEKIVLNHFSIRVGILF